MSVTDHTLQVGDDVQLIAGPRRGHRARLVQLGGDTSSRHTVRFEDGQTARVSKAHVQRTDRAS
jgi:hypothetical protein